MRRSIERCTLLAIIMSAAMLAGHPARVAAQPASDSGSDSVRASQSQSQSPRKQWYERLSLRGYTQLRYNRLLETNPVPVIWTKLSAVTVTAPPGALVVRL